MQIEDEVFAIINESRPGWLEPFDSKESRDLIVQQIQELNNIITEIPEVPAKKDVRVFEKIEHQADLISKNAEVMQVELEDLNESKKNESNLNIETEVSHVIDAMYELIEQYQGMLAQGEIGFYNQHISDLLKAINILKAHKEDMINKKMEENNANRQRCTCYSK